MKQARGDLGERLPLELTGEAHAVERRQRVGARKRHHAVDVEPDQTIGCPGCPTTRTTRRTQIGKVPGRDHREQVVGALVEGELLATRGARLAEVGVPGDHRDRRLRGRAAARAQPAQHRHGAHARRRLLVPVGRGGVDDSGCLEGLGDLRLPLGLDGLADEVAVEQGRRARRARVRDGDETALGARHPQHNVGEGEVGQ